MKARARLQIIIVILCVWGYTFPTWAQSQQAEQFLLSNGLRVVVVPNHKIPAVSHSIWYKVGASDEEPEESGLAHFLEHLLFKQTKNLQEGEFSRLIAYYGGNDNAFTTQDYTTYYQTISKQYLGLVMLLEAERMVNLSLDETTVIRERDIVLEERNMRVDNNPNALLSEKVKYQLYGKNYPYGTPTIGWREEIEALSLPETMQFYRKYYSPNNAVVVVAGDVAPEEVKKLAERYYGQLPSEPRLATRVRKIREAELPENITEQELVLKDKRVEQRNWIRYYLAPSALTGETHHALPLVLLSQILGGGETSRLYQSLVVEQGIATNGWSYYDEVALGKTTFKLMVTPKEGVGFDRISEAVNEEIKQLVEGGISKEELQRAQNLLRASEIYARDSLKAMAFVYGKVLTTGKDINYVDQWSQMITDITEEQVIEAAKYVLQQKNHVTGMLVPDREGS